MGTKIVNEMPKVLKLVHTLNETLTCRSSTLVFAFVSQITLYLDATQFG